MPIEVVMPRLGWDMQVGRLAEWLKHDGDEVAVGDAICTIEGDKATSELESLDSGVLRIPPDSPPPGEEVPVGTVLAYLVGPGEEVSFAAAGGSPGSAGTSAPRAAGAPPIVATPTSSDAGAGPRLGATADDVTVSEPPPTSGSGPRPQAGAAQHQRIREQAQQPGLERTAGAAGIASIGPGRHQALDTGGGGVGSSVTAGAELIGHGRAQPTAAPARRQVASPRARRAAADLGVDVGSVIGSGRAGRVLERDIRAAAAPSGTAPVPFPVAPVAASGTPAERVGPSVAEATAPGPSGTTASGRAADTAAALAGTTTAGPGSAAMAGPTGGTAAGLAVGAAVPDARGDGAAAQPLGQIRRITAARMAESAHTVAPVTLTTEADATRLVELRAQIRADIDALGILAPPLSYNELLVKLLAVALAEQPALNASWRDGRVVQHPDVHIGVAVDTERGLLVPVVRDVRTRSLAAISRELQSLIAAAQDGALSVDQLKGGTFTLTNLGMYDVDAFTPMINLPECAILGVGRIVARPVVVDAGSRDGRRAPYADAQPDLRSSAGRRCAGGPFSPAGQAARRAPDPGLLR